MSKPFFQIMQGSTDVTAKAGGNISLTIVDGVGGDSDSATYEIDDQMGRIAPPRTGVEIRIIGGYLDGPVRDFGIFIVDQVTLAGWPQRISVSAQSAGAKTSIKQRRTKDYPKEKYPTYGDIYDELAGRMGLSPSIASEIKSIPNEYEAQAEESDSAFATRIGANLDAHVSVKNKRLVGVKKGSGKSASGTVLPVYVVAPGLNLIDYSVNVMDTPKHEKVKARSFDRNKVEVEEVEVTSGGEGPEYLVREIFATKDEAQRAADAKAKELKRIEGQANFTIDGDPTVMAEQLVEAKNIRSLVDGLWRATTVTHNWSGSSPYITQLACEKPE